MSHFRSLISSWTYRITKVVLDDWFKEKGSNNRTEWRDAVLQAYLQPLVGVKPKFECNSGQFVGWLRNTRFPPRTPMNHTGCLTSGIARGSTALSAIASMRLSHTPPSYLSGIQNVAQWQETCSLWVSEWKQNSFVLCKNYLTNVGEPHTCTCVSLQFRSSGCSFPRQTWINAS
jgi:hypothetical protein